jgi:hypothetical protein
MIATFLALASFLPSTVAAADPSGATADRPYWANGEVLPPAPTGAAAAHLIAMNDSPPIFESQGDITIQAVVFNNWIKGAGDEEWRTHYGASWDDKINNAVERADDQMYVEFGIDFRVWSIKQWDSYPDGTRDCGSLINELKSDIGVGSGGDTVAGYTGTVISNGAGCSIAYYALVERQGSTADEERYNAWVVTQHEYGHLYNAPDRYPDPYNLHPNDVMEDPYGSPDYWCTKAGYDDWGRIFDARATYE